MTENNNFKRLITNLVDTIKNIKGTEQFNDPAPISLVDINIRNGNDVKNITDEFSYNDRTRLYYIDINHDMKMENLITKCYVENKTIPYSLEGIDKDTIRITVLENKPTKIVIRSGYKI